MATKMSTPYLQLEGINKTFPGVKALSNMQLEVRPGEVHALVGENGAGKSTLIKILAGVEQPDAGGSIRIEGTEVKFHSAYDSVQKGIVVIYQDFSLFPNLSVAENISIGQHPGEKLVRWGTIKKNAEKALSKLNLQVDANTPVGKLSIAKQQMVAISRAVVCDAKMIIMDEPTSALSKGEVKTLFQIVNTLKQEGIAILFVSHKLEELFEIADRFTVIRDGNYIATNNKEELDHDKLISLMVGRSIAFTRQPCNPGNEVVLEVKDLHKKGNFTNINFNLRRGEILGFTGLVGAGRTELAQAIFGINPPDSGEIYIHDQKVTINSSSDAVRHHIAYMPESRQTQGLVLSKNVEDNIAITVLDKLLNRLGLINNHKKRQVAKTWIGKLNIKPPYPDMLVQQFSGGNQQRVVLAKWLANDLDILIVDEPTNGVDIGAKSEIHDILRDLAKQGIGVIMISSELPEILAVSDRILVMKQGRITAEFAGDQATQEEIMNKAILNSSRK